MLVVVADGALDSIVGVPRFIKGTIRRDSDAGAVLSKPSPQFGSARIKLLTRAGKLELITTQEPC
jgi:hypothetical protein